MKVLQKHERKNGYDYYLEDRNEHCAVYRQYDSELDLICAYEVFKIKTRKETKIKDNIIEGGEVFPGNNDFGKSAWSIGTFVSRSFKEREPENYKKSLDKAKKRAFEKFKILTEKNEKNE